MPTHSPSVAASAQPSSNIGTNRLLGLMPPESRSHLLAQCSRVPMRKHDVLSEAGSRHAWVYFPGSGLVSMQTTTEAGDSIEIAMIGAEGVISPIACASSGVALYTAVVSVPGESLRMRSDELLAEFERSQLCRRVLLNHSHAFLGDVAQGSACHRFHTARQRLATWVLTVSDRTGLSRIEMTQEELAQRLGLQRTRVTAANLSLQDIGALRARHGRITIQDRRRLELAACTCYRSSLSFS